jgi:hypothetical protein
MLYKKVLTGVVRKDCIRCGNDVFLGPFLQIRHACFWANVSQPPLLYDNLFVVVWKDAVLKMLQ